MKYILYAIILFAFNSCKSKYDTSKAIDIISTENISTDYNLKNIPFQIDDYSSVAQIEGQHSKFEEKINRSIKSIEYYNNKLFIAMDNNLAIVQLDLEKNDKNKKKYLSHDILNPFLTIHNEYIILYDEKGNFFVFNSETLEKTWVGRIGVSEDDFIKEKQEKGLLETLNPSQPKQALALSSQFVCSSNKCYAISADGMIVVMDLLNREVNLKQILPHQDIVLNNLYKPKIINDNIVFATGNSEFTIFNISKFAILAKSSFVEQESGSIFDVNLVKSIHTAENSVIISHLNGIYAFDILHGKSLWFKNFVTEHILISHQYMILFDEKIKKIICLHIKTGEIKWITEIPKIKSSVLSLNIVQENNNHYMLSIITSNSIHFLSLEDGLQTSFKNGNFSNTLYTFTHNKTLYFIRNGNIYKLK